MVGRRHNNSGVEGVGAGGVVVDVETGTEFLPFFEGNAVAKKLHEAVKGWAAALCESERRRKKKKKRKRKGEKMKKKERRKKKERKRINECSI